MNSWFGIILVSILSCSVYLILGRLISITLGLSRFVSIQFIIGYAASILIFSLINIPFEFLNVKLSVLANVYAVVLLLIMLILTIINKNHLMDVKVIKRFILENWIWVVCFSIIIIIQLVYVLFNGIYGSLWDSSTYTGRVTTALFTDVLNRVNPYTGEPTTFDWLDAFFGLEMHSAVICKLTNMHALIYVNKVLAAIEVLLYNFCAYAIALELFKKDRKKTVVAMAFLFLINLGMYPKYTPATFLFFRAGEPKSMLSNVGLMVVLLTLTKLYKQEQDKKNWILLSVSSIFALCLSQTGVFLVPVLLTVGVVPLIVKDFRLIKSYFFCILPSIFFVSIVILKRG